MLEAKESAAADRSEPPGALRLLDLELTNVGPFDRAEIAFATEADGFAPVTLLTGLNGTGKTIVIDAIRGAFGEQYATLERKIWREADPLFSVTLRLRREARAETLRSTGGYIAVGGYGLSVMPQSNIRDLPRDAWSLNATVPWVLDYWRSTNSSKPFTISSLENINPKTFLMNVLQGEVQNTDLTKLLCHFEWLRTSSDEAERREGEVLFDAARRIVRAGLLDGGELTRVERKTLTPFVRQAGHEVPIGQLSSGNLYLIQRMIGLLGKMMAVHELTKSPPESIRLTPGVLLIDEAENHLHPRWQKRLIPILRDLFPNLQIIAATHSPFVLASAPGARVYVCRYEPGATACTIQEETEEYANRGIEDILLSEAFDETQPYSEEISGLLAERKRAVLAGDREARRKVEKELLERNPEHFSYFEIDEKLAALGGKAA